MDLAAADRKPGDTRSAEEVRAEIGRLQDERSRSGEPYVFTGAVSAMCGPYDDVVLPTGTSKNDFELELAAVIGRPARRVSRETALDHVAGYTIVNDITTRERVWRRDLPELGHRLVQGEERPHVPADRTVPGARRVRRRPDGPADHPAAQRAGHAGRVHQGHDLRRRAAGGVLLAGRHAAARRPIAHRQPGGQRHALGTPAAPGDVMEAEISGLGMQRNGCIAEGALR
jgi:hypothetical protein